MSAYNELMDELKEGEIVEGIVFGPWGWGSGPAEGEKWGDGYEEPEDRIPFKLRGKVLTIEQAEPLMQSWDFSGGFGAPECYAVTIWTNKRIFFVVQYDGSTSLNDVPRNPIEHIPTMPGG